MSGGLSGFHFDSDGEGLSSGSMRYVKRVEIVSENSEYKLSARWDDLGRFVNFCLSLKGSSGNVSEFFEDELTEDQIKDALDCLKDKNKEIEQADIETENILNEYYEWLTLRNLKADQYGYILYKNQKKHFAPHVEGLEKTKQKVMKWIKSVDGSLSTGRPRPIKRK